MGGCTAVSGQPGGQADRPPLGVGEGGDVRVSAGAVVPGATAYGAGFRCAPSPIGRIRCRASSRPTSSRTVDGQPPALGPVTVSDGTATRHGPGRHGPRRRQTVSVGLRDEGNGLSPRADAAAPSTSPPSCPRSGCWRSLRSASTGWSATASPGGRPQLSSLFAGNLGPHGLHRGRGASCRDAEGPLHVPAREEISRPSSKTTGGKLCGWYTSTRSLPGKLKAAGATPATNLGRPSMLTVSPTTDGSPPKRRIQNSWLSTTTASAPSCSSAATKPRPAANGSFGTNIAHTAVAVPAVRESAHPPVDARPGGGEQGPTRRGEGGTRPRSRVRRASVEYRRAGGLRTRSRFCEIPKKPRIRWENRGALRVRTGQKTPDRTRNGWQWAAKRNIHGRVLPSPRWPAVRRQPATIRSR